jgi:DNA-binding NtrC family response regulator
MDNTVKKESIRLLLVDDEPGFREAVARRLEKRGFTVSQAADGQSCLAAMDSQGADVVVLDVKMPGMGGIETLKAVKDRHKTAQVILLTGNAAVSDGIEGIKAGAFDYLTKPVEIDHLEKKIRQAWDVIRFEIQKQEEAEYRARLEKKNDRCGPACFPGNHVHRHCP